MPEIDHTLQVPAQRPPDTTGPAVALTPTAVRVHADVTDPGVLAAARGLPAGTDLHAWFCSALRIGAIAMDTAGPVSEVQRLREETTRLMAALEQSTRDTVQRVTDQNARATQAAADRMTSEVTAQCDRLATGVAHLVTGTDAAVPAHLRGAVDSILSRTTTDLRAMLTTQQTQVAAAVATAQAAAHDQVRSAIGSQLAAVQTMVSELVAQTRATQAADAELRRGHRKGLIAETALIDHVRAAVGPSCTVEHVGATRGQRGVLVGDIVVSPIDGPSVLIEVKDASGLTLDVIRKQAVAGRANRSAGSSVTVVAAPDQMPDGARIRVVSPVDLAVVWAPGDDPVVLETCLITALLLGRAHHSTDQSDADRALRTAAAQATTMLAAIARIERAASTQASGAARLRDSIVALHTELAAHLATMQVRPSR